MRVTASLDERVGLWRGVVAPPARFARHAGVVVALMAIALLARPGTVGFRAAALIACLALLATSLTAWVLRRRYPDALHLVRQVIVPTDRALGEKTLRATRLARRCEREAGGITRALSEHHLEQLIQQAHPDRVRDAARRRARAYRSLGLLLAAALGVAALFARLEIAEGLNVLATSGTTAPIAMQWTRRLRMVAQPPAYLDQPARRLPPGVSTLLPRGTELTLRARPRHPGRRLVVTDGQVEEAFVSDGEGGLVAHYTVGESASLHVAARFGDVLIAEPSALRIMAVPDHAPRVRLEGAPRSIKLAEMERLELRWSALDDHGLEQVDVVLRSGDREERRTLARYDGETGPQQGGYALSPTDAFLRLSFVPVEVTVEAQDNDPVSGSKWGKSEAISLVPTAVGAPEAARYLGLASARAQFVDALAAAEAARLAPGSRDFDATLARALERSREVLDASYDGRSVPAGFSSFARGQLRLVTEHRGPPSSYENLLGRLILAFDSGLSGLSRRDAQRVSLVLAEIAEEAMVGAELAGSAEDRERGRARLHEALVALDAGTTELLALGALGHDLGGVARADLGRVRTATEARDYYHAELAARHLADRLRRPRPSFGSSGGGGGGGVESGRSQASEPRENPSSAPGEFDRLARQIAQLAREHENAVDQVDRTLSDAKVGSESSDALRQEAEQRAGELRDAVDGLPLPGDPPGTARADAALGREHARAMAHGMESLQLSRALESGRKARSNLERARARAGDNPRLSAQIEDAEQTLAEQLEWLEQRVDQSESEARERAREALEASSQLESELAKTARGLEQRGREGQAPLPGDVQQRLRAAGDLMQQAADALKRGEGEQGLGLQRDAQRLLERADRGGTRDGGDDERSVGGEHGDGPHDEFAGDVPDADELTEAEAFRRRVIENLGEKATGRLAPAIRRYAEGLLR